MKIITFNVVDQMDGKPSTELPAGNTVQFIFDKKVLTVKVEENRLRIDKSGGEQDNYHYSKPVICPQAGNVITVE